MNPADGVGERVELESDGWSILLDAVSDSRATVERLKSQGGFGVTHRAVIKRRDSDRFELGDVESLVACLKVFLSFAAGRHVGVGLSSGTRPGEGIVYRDFALDYVDDWSSFRSWFDTHHASILTEAFPLFARKFLNPQARETLSASVYWYLKSNVASGGLDGSLIIAQAGLELLSWEILVRQTGTLSEKGFKTQKAAIQIRMLMERLGVPVVIPSELSQLTEVGNPLEWDGPRAIAAILNSLVHPNPKRRAATRLCHSDAWSLALHYLELAILGWCGYTGVYSDRIRDQWRGQVRPVPWNR
jgi:hypothetical protein